MAADPAGTKNVTLTAAEDRRSLRWGVKALGEKLDAKRAEVVAARRAMDTAVATYTGLDLQAGALADAYDLVKPQPRTRKGKP
jgi:hypothetical protein